MNYSELQQITIGFEQKARQIGGGQAWIFRAKRSRREPDKSLLTKLNSIATDMPTSEEHKLTDRFKAIIPDNAQAFKEEYDNQFLDALVEVLGCGWLDDHYPSHEVQFSEPPDIIVRDDANNAIGAMACKKIRTSDEDREYFKYHQGELREVDDKITLPEQEDDPFLKKVKGTLWKAEEQLSRVTASSDKFIFINFTWDIPALILKPQVVQLISRLAVELKNQDITLIAIENYQWNDPLTSA